MAAAEDEYFYEDEVYRVNKRGHIEFGMVLENSELVSSDENSDTEDASKMKKGHIRVAWHPSGVEEVISQKKVGLADRSLMPGDVVRRMIKGKDTQRGYCRNISVNACVQVVGTKQVIPNVKSEHLVPLEEFAADIAVCLDSWVGGVKMVHSKLHLYLPDSGMGSRCVINELEANGLEEFDEKRDADTEFPHRNDYYPGQVLYGPLHCLEYANWTLCSKEMKSLRSKPNKTVQVVVERVETTSVGVHWQCRAYSKDGAGNDKEQPKFLVSGDDLKRLNLLNVFEPCTLQVGDRNYYTFRDTDSVITKEQWKRNQREQFKVNSCIRDGGGVPASGNSQNSHKSCSRPPLPRPSQDIRITYSIDNKTAESSQVRSKEGFLDQSRKKRILGDSKVNHCKPLSKSSSPSSKRLASGECHVDDSSAMNTDDVDGASTLPPALEDSKNFLRVLRPNHLLPNADDDADSTSEDTSISSGCSSTGSTGLKKRGPALMTKVLKKKKLRRAKKRAPQISLEPGSKVVVETLSTTSVADVIWQDGSVEFGIPSTQLYPIHHLDDQEFFPGDFVMDNKEDNSCTCIYGVIQSVDHGGRTAKVKWFKTYTCLEEPRPTFIDENEVSVYDLKDHPDFQYRPGTVVIRVANFEGEDANCTAGQVLDNYPEGRVCVWWVVGHVSMCWPQDLYKVGEYDSDDGELWDDSTSDASWETESVDSFVADEENDEPLDNLQTLRPKLAVNIEKARIAMARLEEIFTQNPALQTTEVMRKLLEVYKDCRYLDKLMGTSFFHESHFEGLLERVRERGRVNVAQRVADQVSRLFQPSSNAPSPPVVDADVEAFPELRVAMQMADQINDLVRSQGRAAQTSQQRNCSNFLDKLSEHHISVKKVSNQILQLFQKTLFSRTTSNQDKDQCNNEKRESSAPQEASRSPGRVLGEVKFSCTDAESEVAKPYTLRLRFLHHDEPATVSSEASSTEASASQSSSIVREEIDNKPDSKVTECKSEESIKEKKSEEHKDEKVTNHSSLTSGEFLTESVTNLQLALASGATRKLARRMSSILSRFGNVTCELVMGDEVLYSMDLGSGNESRSRHTQTSSTRPTPPSSSWRYFPLTPSTRSAKQQEVAHSSPKGKEPEKNAQDEGAASGAHACAVGPSEAFQPANGLLHNPFNNSTACVRLCALIKAQLVKAHAEVTRRFGGEQLNMSLSDAANSVSPSNKDVDDEYTMNVDGCVNAEAGSSHALVLKTEMTQMHIETPEQLDSSSAPDGSQIGTVSTLDERPPASSPPPAKEGGFSIEDTAPNCHKYKLTMFSPVDNQTLYRTVRKEIKLLRASLPNGIWVKGFEDRMDLYSVMIRGPEKTPYEDGLFLFDFQLSSLYPNEPPLCHYISYCSDRLNPNLYEDGKVCVSLLGTWSGRGTELWTPTSNLLQVIVSIQGLILVNEPYFNEAGYEKQKGSQQGRENSRMYNEMVILKLVQSMTKLVQNPPSVFQDEIRQHFRENAVRFAARLDKWLEISDMCNGTTSSPTSPTRLKDSDRLDNELSEFPLIPASKGFCLTLRKTLAVFREVLSSVGILDQHSNSSRTSSPS